MPTNANETPTHSDASPVTLFEKILTSKPFFIRHRRAAFAAVLALPMRTLLTFAKHGSFGVGVSGMLPLRPSSSRRRTEAGRRESSLYLQWGENGLKERKKKPRPMAKKAHTCHTRITHQQRRSYREPWAQRRSPGCRCPRRLTEGSSLVDEGTPIGPTGHLRKREFVVEAK